MNQSEKKTYQNFEKTLINFIPHNEQLKILDLGCGNGEAGKILVNNFGAEVIGVTISEDECENAKKIINKCFVYDLNNGLPEEIKKEKFDYIYMSHVLEHICYPESLLKEIGEVLDINGSILIALPNIMHYNSRFKLFYGDFEYTDTGIYDYTHFRWYTYKSAEELFIKYNYKVIIKDVSIHLPLGRITNKILWPGLKKMVIKLLKSISPGFFGWELVFVLKK
jgi:2-polyprenyl-3-methyl-5-hydroxy-6-metoxy-1,4-benzoquinol methylase